MKQKEYFGFGSISNLSDILKKNKINNIFLVTGKNSYYSCGAERELKKLSKNYTISRFSDFDTNPKLNDVQKGIALFCKANYDIVIGVGGGTVIDMAKLINIFSVQNGNIGDFIKKKKRLTNCRKPLIAIPTTSGTGSEATHFAVIYINKTKYSVAHESLLPDFSIVDPIFTMDLPPKIKASTGMDALSQAIESYWCINSTKESKDYSKESIKLSMNYLESAVNNPSEESIIGMAKASNLAGKAINITKTTAPHAISYPLTSHFGIPHGHAVALTLPEILVYNFKVTENDILDSRGVKYVQNTIKEVVQLLSAKDEQTAKTILTNLMSKIGLETNLKTLGINNVETIVAKFDTDRVKNNPRLLTKNNLRNILYNLFK